MLYRHTGPNQFEPFTEEEESAERASWVPGEPNSRKGPGDIEIVNTPEQRAEIMARGAADKLDRGKHVLRRELEKEALARIQVHLPHVTEMQYVRVVFDTMSGLAPGAKVAGGPVDKADAIKTVLDTELAKFDIDVVSLTDSERADLQALIDGYDITTSPGWPA